MKYIAAIILLASAVLMSGGLHAYASDYNVRVACQSQVELELIIEQWVPVDENGKAMSECSLLPNDSPFESRKIVRGLRVPCILDGQPTFCPVWIVEATISDRTIWYEVGFLEIIPIDAFEEGVVGVDEPILMVGMPGGGVKTILPEVPPVTMVADLQAEEKLPASSK